MVRFAHVCREPPQIVPKLMKKIEEYARAEDDELRERQQRHPKDPHPHHENWKMREHEREGWVGGEEPRRKELPRRPTQEVHTIESSRNQDECRDEHSDMHLEEHWDDLKWARPSEGSR